MTRRLLFTGGHHNSALAVASYLKSQHPDGEIYWLGHRCSMAGDRRESAEYLEVTAAGIPFYDLKAGKLYNLTNPLRVLKILGGFGQALVLLLKIRPTLIVSFGGYLAVPVVIVGWLLRIPSVTHEQTVVAGYANRLLARFAGKVLLSWPQSERYYPSQKVVVTGLPLREDFLKLAASRPLPRPPRGRPVVLVTGGKQGAHALNLAVREALADLLSEMEIIHQTGRSSLFDDFGQAQSQRESLETSLKRSYRVRSYVTGSEWTKLFSEADLVVSRSGAHTTSELLLLGKPALLIPHPRTHHEEQLKNAQYLKEAGLAEILEQKDLTGETLARSIRRMLKNLNSYQVKPGYDLIRDGTERVAAEILKLIPG